MKQWTSVYHCTLQLIDCSLGETGQYRERKQREGEKLFIRIVYDQTPNVIRRPIGGLSLAETAALSP